MSSSFKNIRPKAVIQVPEPPIARFLFADTRVAWFWLIVRLYVGYEWLVAGFDKLTGYSLDIGSFGKPVGDLWVCVANRAPGLGFFVKIALRQTSVAHP